jgi:hypothetical protein
MVFSSAYWLDMSVEPESFADEGAKNLWLVHEKSSDVEQTQIWTCTFCSRVFRGWNATKVLYHSARTTGGDIAPCAGRMPAWMIDAYKRVLRTRDEKRREHARVVAASERSVTTELTEQSISNVARRQRASKSSEGDVRHIIFNFLR